METKIRVYIANRDIWGNIRSKMIDPNKQTNEIYYLTKDEASEALKEKERILKLDYEKHKPEAMKKLKKIETEINEVLKESNCEIDFIIEGDTYGIYEGGMELSIKYRGHTYHMEHRGL